LKIDSYIVIFHLNRGRPRLFNGLQQIREINPVTTGTIYRLISWQSDTNARRCRDLIREVLDNAGDAISSDVSIFCSARNARFPGARLADRPLSGPWESSFMRFLNWHRLLFDQSVSFAERTTTMAWMPFHH